MKYLPVLLSIIITGCASNTGTGVISGTVLGASTGWIASGGTAGLIGGAAGAVAGGLVGAVLDQQDRNVMEKSSPRTVDRIDRGAPLTINDIIKLSQNGVSDDTIQGYLEKTWSAYSLSQTQVRRLQESGVSQRVINTMLEMGQ